MTPTLQRTVYECHPELAFRSLTARPMRFNKKTKAGRNERLRALERHAGPLFTRLRQECTNALAGYPRRKVAPDDLVDAWALAWTALRVFNQTAHCVPVHPPTDSKGLRMEIWY